MKKQVALICTTYNCKDELNDALTFFTSNENLEFLNELIIVDGGSNDGTWELLKDWAQKVDKLKVYQVPGANISRGRNEAIRQATADIIVVFDSGTKYETNWLQLMLRPFEKEEASVVGGLTICYGENIFEKSFAGFDNRKWIDENWGSSHRGIAYLKNVWQQIGGYPEDVEAGEDSWFNTQWKNLGYKYVHVPEAKNYWRVRKNWKGVFKMSRRNTKGHVALCETSGMAIIVLITAVYMICSLCILLGFYNSVFWYAAGILYGLHVSKRMLGKGRWRTFLNPVTFIVGFYGLTASDLGTVWGTFEGFVQIIKKKRVQV